MIKKFNTVQELVLNVPRFEFTSLIDDNYNYHILIKKYDNDPFLAEYVNRLNSEYAYNDYNSKRYNYTNNYIKSIEEEIYNNILKNSHFTKLRSGSIFYKPYEISNYMIQCNNCGNIWDGNAQCNCFMYDDLL